MGKYPVPRRKTELAVAGSSPVTTRQMTDEERIRYGLVGPLSDRNGQLIKQPTVCGNFPQKQERVNDVKTELTKELYQKEKAAGKTNAQIEREYGLKPNSIYAELKKWGITGPKVEPIANLQQATASAPTQAFAPIAPAPVDDKLAAVQKYIRDLLGSDPSQIIYDQIAAERDRQDKLHPEFQLDLRMDVLVEEVGEVAKAKLEGKQSELRKELIEVAAVAVRWIEMLDREVK